MFSCTIETNHWNFMYMRDARYSVLTFNGSYSCSVLMLSFASWPCIGIEIRSFGSHKHLLSWKYGLRKLFLLYYSTLLIRYCSLSVNSELYCTSCQRLINLLLIMISVLKIIVIIILWLISHIHSTKTIVDIDSFYFAVLMYLLSFGLQLPYNAVHA